MNDQEWEKWQQEYDQKIKDCPLQFNGRTSAYAHKHIKPNEPIPKLAENECKAVRKIWVLDAQWSDCPVEIEAIVRQLWRYYERGNDHYIIKLDFGGMKELAAEGATEEVLENHQWIQKPIDFATLTAYLKSKGVTDDDTVWIHWWW